MKQKYPVVLTQDLVWSDMDAFKHVNNAVYFRFFENARIAYFEKVKLIDYKEKTGIGPILASTHCNFRAPLTFPDRIQIATRVERIKGKTVRMKYIVYSERQHKVAADG